MSHGRADAYAYESAKYLADARACDKLSFVSRGAFEQIQTGLGRAGGRSSALVP
jgi:hypothetical protein